MYAPHTRTTDGFAWVDRSKDSHVEIQLVPDRTLVLQTIDGPLGVVFAGDIGQHCDARVVQCGHDIPRRPDAGDHDRRTVGGDDGQVVVEPAIAAEHDVGRHGPPTVRR